MFLKLDAENGEGIELAKRYSVSGYPSWILTNAKGEVLDRWAGYEGPESFSAAVHKGLDDPTTVEQKITRYAKGATLEDAEKIARILSEGADYDRGIQYYREAAKLDADSDYAYEIFETSVQACRHDVYAIEKVTETANAALASEQVGRFQKGTVYFYTRWLAGKKDLDDYALQFLTPAYEAVRGGESEELQDIANELSIEQALHIEKDAAKAAQLKFDSMGEDWQENAQSLNSYAWWCFENQVDLERAESLALKAVELSEAGPDRAMILDTAAELCRSLGKREQALELMEQAVTEDPANDDYRSKLEDWRRMES